MGLELYVDHHPLSPPWTAPAWTLSRPDPGQHLRHRPLGGDLVAMPNFSGARPPHRRGLFLVIWPTARQSSVSLWLLAPFARRKGLLKEALMTSPWRYTLSGNSRKGSRGVYRKGKRPFSWHQIVKGPLKHLNFSRLNDRIEPSIIACASYFFEVLFYGFIAA